MRKLRVLCVDDEQNCVTLHARVLEQAGYESVAVVSSGKALTLFERGEHFDLVVTDQNRPGMKGDIFARTLRNRGFKGTIISITGYPEMVIDRAAFDHILEKPVNPDELVELVRSQNQ